MADLLHGPYAAPDVRRDDWVEDEVLGLVQVGGWSDAPLAWPRRKKTGRASLILTGDLVRAVRDESVAAVVAHWGVSPVTVWTWRKALGVERVTDGTRELLRERTGVPAEAAARGLAKAHTLESRAKAAATRTGRPASQATRDALLAAAKRPKPAGWGKRANGWMRSGGPRTKAAEEDDDV